MKKLQIKQSHFYSQTQETEVMFSKKPVNTTKKHKRTQILKNIAKTKGVTRSPLKHVQFVSKANQEEIEPSPLSQKYATISSATIETATTSQKFSSSKKLNFFTQ